MSWLLLLFWFVALGSERSSTKARKCKAKISPANCDLGSRTQESRAAGSKVDR